MHAEFPVGYTANTKSGFEGSYMRVLLFLAVACWSTGVLSADLAVHSARGGSYSLDISGEIRAGDAERLTQIFMGKKRFPSTTRVGTTGGSLKEAMRIGELFRLAHLSVLASDSCDLPCFTALVGGISRAISTDLVLVTPADHRQELADYYGQMGLPPSLVTSLVFDDQPVALSLGSFDELVGESPVVFEQSLAEQCGLQTEEENFDFRSLQAARFVESLRSMQARTGREEEMAPLIAKYEALAEHAEDFSDEYRQRLYIQWREISDCRKHVLKQAQKNAFQQVVASS